jgi:hypothetical protein
MAALLAVELAHGTVLLVRTARVPRVARKGQAS